MAEPAPRDRVIVDYSIPLGAAGHLCLLVNVTASPDKAHADFIISVLARVSEISGQARALHPEAAAPAVPAGLRGVGGRA
jgi:hypothetical protein